MSPPLPIGASLIKPGGWGGGVALFKHADLPSLRGDKDIRVISPDTGGGFGIRGEVSAEACLVLFAADQLNCPVRYLGDRSEMFIADAHGRDNLTTATAGFDATGKLTALRVETTANLGAYCTAVGPFVPTMAGGRIVGFCLPHSPSPPGFAPTLAGGAIGCRTTRRVLMEGVWGAAGTGSWGTRA
ncbi:MAG: hypothetical protein CM15mP120_11760 [Pseudomonadota bacterium]|nr:MAG: hypothetical protein CM15mP120_11760 [Pseudomonadota bacterium]